MPGIEATRVVPAPREAVFAYLSSLENHWRLADRWIEVLSLERPPGVGADASPDRGTVRMRGPLGVGRTAATRVAAVAPPRSLEGVAEIGSGTSARVSWTLHPRDGGTDVRLSARVERAGMLDRLLLAAGGVLWLRQRFRSVLERLAAMAGSGQLEAGAAKREEQRAGGAREGVTR